MYTVPDQSGRYVVVTGANSGTGKETVRALAGAGAEVVMAVRSLERGEAARADIAAGNPRSRLTLRRLDLSVLASVREFAAEMRAEDRPVDVLVNNAGVMAVPERTLSPDGFELQFASNVVGPFALTNLLLSLLLASEAPRVATISSPAARSGRIDFGDLDAERGYRPMRAYAQSKLADLLLGRRLAELADERGWPLRSTIAHPGFARTNLFSAGPSLGRDAPNPLLSRAIDVFPSHDAAAGAESLLYAVLDPGAVNGAYYGPRGAWQLTGSPTRLPLPRSARGATLARSLWAVLEDRTGTRPPD